MVRRRIALLSIPCLLSISLFGAGCLGHQSAPPQLQTVPTQPTAPVNERSTAKQNYLQYIPSVVELYCDQPDGSTQGGSGIIRRSKTGLRIWTNAHVIGSASQCRVGITTDPHQPPKPLYIATIEQMTKEPDIAVLDIKQDIKGGAVSDSALASLVSVPDYCRQNQMTIGDKLVVIGYPEIGGDTITVTDGLISGFAPHYIKTSAKIAHGNSGGLALHESGCVIGIASMVETGEMESLGYIIDIDELLSHK